MDDLNVIDRFMEAFIRYIDSGFGLLGGDVAFLTSILIGIDITLAGLFWAMGGENDVIAKLLKKILYVGVFAFIIGNFGALSDIIFRSFAGLGITAGGGTISAEDLLKPGRLAGAGFEAAHPLIDQIKDMLGPIAFFENFLEIVVLLIAWVLTILAFFILAIQLFITLIEFKLTSLAGFALMPFALWNRTAFLAERVLGSIVSSGVKVMVLGVIVGIGSGFFPDFLTSMAGSEPDVEEAMSLALGALALLGLGIFGPGIASGLVAGAPQLGAGAAVGTVAAAAGTMVVAGGAGLAAARAGGGAALGAVRAGTSMGAAASTAYTLGQETTGSPSVGAGLGGVATAMQGAAANAARRAGAGLGISEAAAAGRDAAWDAGNRTDRAAPSSSPENATSSSAAPAWAAGLKADQRRRAARQAAVHVLSDGSRGGSGASPDIAEKED
ncbi:P-type conjugative transfer protein TrbL [Sphingopyxis bauzanensis]|uniref:P-type conjugative transfer protein TrbL n=1 Tax=Sphingopyxis bauzanensis TaxID=651663 RepID=A0A246JVK5_9SPHN|nr:P-type conjugative transfer protein TrbL [Sphingopyxis bauzanensis]OWQ97068.1 P-type conjugative transfer protein TrbL [Sphingopyxis bauzanensis]GGJ41243.1 conjugal transfer protein TrbL [Sphingopyxis bauzanensis]